MVLVNAAEGGDDNPQPSRLLLTVMIRMLVVVVVVVQGCALHASASSSLRALTRSLPRAASMPPLVTWERQESSQPAS